MVNGKRLTDTFCKLVSIDSLSLEERQMADHLTGILKNLGFTVSEDDTAAKIGGNAGNLHGFLPGKLNDEDPILLCCHMDTMEPGYGKKAILHDDGTITSDGTTVLGADDLSGIAAILEALQVIKEQGKPHRPIEILFTVAEEIHCRGIANYDKKSLVSKECYVLDLTGPVGSAASEAPCIILFDVKVNGKPAHAGFAPEQGIHSIKAATSAISRLDLGNIEGGLTVNIGVIEGGTRTNVVPETTIIKGEVRSFDNDSAMVHVEKILRTFEEEAKAIGATVDTSYERVSMAYKVDDKSATVKRFRAACEKLGLPISIAPTKGLSDLNHLHNFGIPGMVLANAMERCHSTDEYTTVDELENIANLVLELMT